MHREDKFSGISTFFIGDKRFGKIANMSYEEVVLFVTATRKETKIYAIS